MLRLIALLLVLGGGAAVAWGGWQMMDPLPPESRQASPVIVEPPRNAASESAETAAVRAPPTARGFSAGGPNEALANAQNGLDVEAFKIATADRAFADSLKTVPIAHETPKQAKFGRSFEVYVALDGTGDTSAADALPRRGNVVESEATVSTTVQASISGQSFEVDPLTPLIQKVSPLTENVWRWKVTPLEIGPQELVIELFALSEGEAMPVRTFRDRVEVEVSRIGQVVALANSVSPIAMVAGGIGSLLAGLLGVFRLFRGGS